MHSRILCGLLAGAFTTLGAQEIGVLNQAFQLRHDGWNWTGLPSQSYTTAVYDFTLGMPVASYRLGALALNGSIDYSRATSGPDSDSTFGLHRYGASVNLFPYRPFRLRLDFQHTSFPLLLGTGTARSNAFSAAFLFRGRTVQDLAIGFRRGTATGPSEDQSWTQWSLRARQRFHRTDTTLELVRDAFTYGPGLSYSNAYLTARADTPVQAHGRLHTLVGASSSSGLHRVSAGMDLSLGGRPWTSLTSVSVQRARFGGESQSLVQAAESFARSGSRWSAFGSLSAASMDSSARDASRSVALTVGATAALSPTWRFACDASRSSSSHRLAGEPGPDRQGALSLHAGLYRDGDLPGVLKQVLFGLSDVAFQWRIREQYPPGYFPSELAQQMVARRVRQNGGFGFTADYSRIRPVNGEGRVDFAKVTGDLRVNHHLHFMAIGDWRDDRGHLAPGVWTKDRLLNLTGAYSIGRTSFNAFLGSSHHERRPAVPGAPAEPTGTALGSWLDQGTTTYYGIGIGSRVGRIPLSTSWSRTQHAIEGPSTAFHAHASLAFRMVAMSVSYTRGTRWDGLRNSHISFSLGRSFESIALWGNGPW
jgi:hypothetical protein